VRIWLPHHDWLLWGKSNFRPQFVFHEALCEVLPTLIMYGSIGLLGGCRCIGGTWKAAVEIFYSPAPSSKRHRSLSLSTFHCDMKEHFKHIQIVLVICSSSCLFPVFLFSPAVSFSFLPQKNQRRVLSIYYLACNKHIQALHSAHSIQENSSPLQWTLIVLYNPKRCSS
jgi:hypothetical protein